MAKGPKYVEEFDFGPQKVHVRPYCRGGAVKMSEGGKVPPVVKAAVHKHESAMHPGKPKTALKCGGKVRMK